MNKHTKIKELRDYERRIMLNIYSYGINNKKTDNQIKSVMRKTLETYLEDFTEEDLQTMFNDCKMHTYISTFFEASQNGKFESSKIKKGKLLEFVKDYTIQKYLELDKDSKEEIIETQAKKLISEGFEWLNNRNIEIDFISYVKTKLHIGKELTKEDLIEFFKNKRKYELLIKEYIRSLLEDEKLNMPIEQLKEELQSYRISMQDINDYIDRIKRKKNARKDLFITDEETIELVKKPSFSIEIAREFLSDENVTKTLGRSLVEDKLLTMYLKVGYLTEFEKLAKEKMGCKEGTEKMQNDDVRTASKYIKFLLNTSGDKKDELSTDNFTDTSKALAFIENNEELLRRDLVVMNQWFNIYFYHSNDIEFKEEGIIKVAGAISENVEIDTQTENRGFIIKDIKPEGFDYRNRKFLNTLIREFTTIQEKAKGRRINELKRIREKLLILRNVANEKNYRGNVSQQYKKGDYR